MRARSASTETSTPNAATVDAAFVPDEDDGEEEAVGLLFEPLEEEEEEEEELICALALVQSTSTRLDPSYSVHTQV